MLFCMMTSERLVFLDFFFFSLQSVFTDQELNIMVWNNTAGIGIFIKFANTEFTDEARSSNMECFSSHGNVFTSGFLPSLKIIEFLL